MKLTYEYANRDKTSVLLRFSGVIEDQTICLLVDSGEGVDVDRMLDEDEYLTGILLTHLHVDHYSSIDQNLRDGARIYSSQTNIDILSTVMDEFRKTVIIVISTQKQLKQLLPQSKMKLPLEGISTSSLFCSSRPYTRSNWILYRVRT